MDFDFSSYTHDLMVSVIREHYPTMVHGRNYLVAHPLDPATGEQNGDPRIVSWANADIEQPKDEDIHALFHADEAKYRAAFIRRLRDEALSNTDGKASTPVDAPPALQTGAAAWRVYRQALRDIPQQAGFPFSIEWPERPQN
ncbi:hypothetical protein OKW45_001943 [Paraburkholderia sp. WSM4175]|uniref:XkdW family protein n=1 Tax=Paraburkholderia sp. WSM4175 TaxID=2991072 RepID=UPI003D25E844